VSVAYGVQRELRGQERGGGTRQYSKGALEGNTWKSLDMDGGRKACMHLKDRESCTSGLPSYFPTSIIISHGGQPLPGPFAGMPAQAGGDLPSSS
jgi:hypothetical protein